MKVIIIGAGIGGLCAAIALQQQGVEVKVYEMTRVLKPVGAGVGLAANAIKGLEKIGLATEVIKAGKALTALQMKDERGSVISNQNASLFNKQYGEHNLVIHRAELHEILVQRLEKGTLHLGKRCRYIEQRRSKVYVHFSDEETVEGDLLIAADGIHSVVRSQLMPYSKPRYAGYTCWRAVIENPGVTFDTMVSAETWAAQGRVGMAALPNNRIYWYCCIKADRKEEKMRRMTPMQLANYFRGVHEPIEAVLRATKPEEIIWNDINDIKPLSTFVFERAVLLGDAAHATTPNMGQGACQAIEDAIVLADCLKSQPDLAAALSLYEKRRVKRTAKVIRLSRLIGYVSHWRHPLSRYFRNFVFRNMPEAIARKQMKWLFDVDF
ncbi:MAG TPA: FAD-dependent monooxygenase [Pseudosphingobacterium sp.]|nr:FAD-dependent monooxygenase [Pseudosphingobacterium sp.]